MLLLAAGCGGEAGPPRRPVSGAITLDGKPLDAGTITFLPAEGGIPATAELLAGSFATDRTRGPTPGPYRVEIVSVRPTGKRIPHPDLPSETIEEVCNVIPQRYNVRSELQVEVKPEGENQFTFALSSSQERDRAGGRRIAGSRGANGRRRSTSYQE
jgi:hypothetical protein